MRHNQRKLHIDPVMRLTPTAAADTYELIIYGDIGESWWGESVTAQSVAEQLNTLDSGVTTINVRINSYGGSVADGLAIYNALKRHSAKKLVTVDGVAMSSASLIAMAGTTITMPSTSLLMIHAPWGGCYGNAKEMRKYADVLDKFSASMADAYIAKSGKSHDDIIALLTDGEDHYYTGEEAVAEGFADSVTADDPIETEPDENARAFANALLKRISARGASARYAAMAVAAAMRPAPHATQVTTKTIPAEESLSRLAIVAVSNSLSSVGISNPPASSGITAGVNKMTEEEKKAAAKAALEEDKNRRESIAAQFKPFLNRSDISQSELSTLQRTCEDDQNITVDTAGRKLLEFLGKGTESLGRGDVSIGKDERDHYRDGAINALLYRANPAVNKLSDNGQKFRGMNLSDLARDSLEVIGKKTRGMTKGEIAVQALQSTSDFPAILENIITKTLRDGYTAAGRTFASWARQGASLPDFKQISRTQLSCAPGLKRVVEGAEYEYGIFSDGAEKYAVQKYGRIVHITWETIVNDDLDAFTRIPGAFGTSAGELESDIVYGILTSSTLMADETELFHAKHGNIGTPAPLTDAFDPSKVNPIAEMRKLMLLQKGLEGRYITVRPRYLLVPPDLEEVALKVTSANLVAARISDQNVIGTSLVPVVEPRLHDASPSAWYGACEPNTVDTIEYAYLEGYEGVFTETKQGFDVDGMKVKCRHVFGAKAIDWRGLFKNSGMS